LFIPDSPPAKARDVHRAFSIAMVLSGLRCLLSYLVFPIVLPALGAASVVGPAVGIPVALLALVFDVRGIRRFWLADHPSKWAFTWIYVAVMVLVLSLLIVDIHRLVV
jgi:hypothetical protein